MSGPRVAVMQPYFYPYAGYFRLMGAADIFVVLDDVQFPRRGRVHRSEVQRTDGSPIWLTLPLQRQPREVRIADLQFAADARERLDERLSACAWMTPASSELGGAVRSHLLGQLASVTDFLQDGLALLNEGLGLGAAMARSTALDIDSGLRGQDRIIAIVRAVGGETYVNAPGGRELYDARGFAAADLQLRFLPPYQGPFVHLLPALISEASQTIRADIMEDLRLLP